MVRDSFDIRLGFCMQRRERAGLGAFGCVHSLYPTWHPLVETEGAAADNRVRGAGNALFWCRVKVVEKGGRELIGPNRALVIGVWSRALTLRRRRGLSETVIIMLKQRKSY
jgi:hypothetical protein